MRSWIVETFETGGGDGVGFQTNRHAINVLGVRFGLTLAGDRDDGQDRLSRRLRKRRPSGNDFD